MRFIIFHHLIPVIKKLLVLGEGPAEGINDSVNAAEKKNSINFSKAKAKFCLSLHHSGVKSGVK